MAVVDTANILDIADRPRRVRHDSGRHYDANGEGDRTLELADIIELLGAYSDYEGGINCCKCGKLYKSKVCFVKHLWEHSVYWDLFAGAKNHERVLAIQAALILSGYHGLTEAGQLLVTAPGHEKMTMTPEKTPEKRTVVTPVKRTVFTPEKRKNSPCKLKNVKKKCKGF